MTRTKPRVWVWLAAIAIVVGMTTDVLATGQGYGPGRIDLKIYSGRDQTIAGIGGIWNSRDKLHIQLDPIGDWRIMGYHIDLGGGEDYSPPLTRSGNPKIGAFDYKGRYDYPYVNEAAEDGHAFRRTLVFDLEEDLGFRWGSPWADLRLQGIAVHLELVKIDHSGNIMHRAGAWVCPELVPLDDAVDANLLASLALPPITDDDGITRLVLDDADYATTKSASVPVVTPEHEAATVATVFDDTEAIIEFEGGRWGWWFRFELGHPDRGHFIDSPVAGLGVKTPTYEGLTAEDAAFDYFPGEEVEISLGSIVLGRTVADHRISPVDLFDQSDTEDVRVINMARLLQSLDEDGQAKGGIVITEPVVGLVEDAMAYFGIEELDFENSIEIETVIDRVVKQSVTLDPPVPLVMVSAEDAKEHLEDTLNNAMFRKNVSKTPELGSAKAKMNIAPVWMPARKANGEPTVVEYYDHTGTLIRTTDQAKPIVITYTDEHPDTGAPEVWAAVSRDDGQTWKRKNLSRAGDRSSFEKPDGTPVYGETKKPVFQIRGNKILIAWSSTYARGGRPRYAIDTEDDYPYDDPYWTDDIWGVAGPQRSHDYTEDGYPEVGVVPYRALWTCRGVIATQNDVNNGLGEFVGDIVWFKPERMTSGRRDVNQIFCGAAPSAGFALVWQEDPKGVRPGKAVGPGPGWGGATTSHKTDIWYSYLSWGDHSKVDGNFVAQGDPEHPIDTIERPKALVPMSLPVRLSDNDVLNTRNMGLDTTTYEEDIAYAEENLTRCVKFEAGRSIVPPDDPDAWQADYPVLRTVPEDHYASMNCINCHVPFGFEPHNEAPTQAAPIPLVVLDAEENDYLGGFTNGDCRSCHYSHVVPRDRVIAMTPGLDDEAKCAECEAKGGVWRDGSDGNEVVEAYFPYEGYPYIFDDGSINDGTHRYGLELEGLLSGEYYTFVNYSGRETSVAITTDGRLMDGDTGAARGNVFLQPYEFTKPDGTIGKSAWAIITYEETKGAGTGPPDDTGEGISHRDDYIPESGKNIIYHSFDFKNPDLVSAGHVINMPECEFTEGVDAYGNEIVDPVLDADGHIIPKYIVDEEGTPILDWMGRPQLAYENARRGRFIMQGVGGVRSSRMVMAMVYKQGEEGSGRPSDIFMRRWVIPEEDITFRYRNGQIVGVASVEGNPYRSENIVGDYVLDPDSEQWYWASGPVNVSSVTPTVTTPSSGDPEHEDAYGAVKVVEWVQTVENLQDLSARNPFDDARAHRGGLRGNFLAVGFSYTDNWAAARNGHDKYDFYIRRSFDGGVTWTTDPSGAGVEHCRLWTYPSGTQSPGLKIEECTFYPAGEFEAMRCMSQLQNNKESVIEPRLVPVPGTIKVAGTWTGIPEDKQNPSVFYVAWGTSDNPIKDPVTHEQDEPTPADLYWTVTTDRGETYYQEEWLVNPDSDGPNAGEVVLRTPWMAKGDPEQGEVQLRMTPDGSRFYASWLDEGEEGSDIVFRRIMSSEFPANIAGTERLRPVVPTKDAVFLKLR